MKPTQITLRAAALLVAAWFGAGAIAADRITATVTTEARDGRPVIPNGFDAITLDGPIGPLSGIISPGNTTWLVAVHGLTEEPADNSVFLESARRQGFTAMAVTYRNQPYGPSSDGIARFGTAEWPDLEVAVGYALDQGAVTVILAGRSHGGAVVASFLARSALASRVDSLVLDAPALDLPRIVGASLRRASPTFGPPIEPATKWLMSSQGFDLPATSLDIQALAIRSPLLLFHGAADQLGAGRCQS